MTFPTTSTARSQRRRLWLSLTVCTISLWYGMTAVAEQSEEKPAAKSCVDVSAEAPYVPYGYNHIVVLHSTCDKTMRCEVKTDVNPKPQTVVLKPGEERQVTTFRGSPARTFTPIVTCKGK